MNLQHWHCKATANLQLLQHRQQDLREIKKVLHQGAPTIAESRKSPPSPEGGKQKTKVAPFREIPMLIWCTMHTAITQKYYFVHTDWATFDGWHQTSKNGIHFSSTRYQNWVTLPQNWDWTTNRIGTHMIFESPSKGAKLSANVLVRVPCKWYCQHLLIQKALESLVKEFGKLTSSHRLYPCLPLLPPLLHLKQGWAGRILWVPNSIPASLEPKSSTSNKPANQTPCPSSPS